MAELARITGLQQLTTQLVQRGWPRDWHEVKRPCWYLLSDEETDGERPTLQPGAAETLAIWPDGPWFLFVDFDPQGFPLQAKVGVHDSPGARVDGDAGVICEPGCNLDNLLAWAEAMYHLWERWGNS